MAEEREKSRRWQRLLAMMLVVGCLWWNYREQGAEMAGPIDAAEAAARFAAEYTPAEGRTLTEICFASTFCGEFGEGLYAVWETGEGDARRTTVEKYVLTEQADGYGFTRKTDLGELNLPEDRFIRYTEEEGVWRTDRPPSKKE